MSRVAAKALGILLLLLSTVSAGRKDQPLARGRVALSDGSFPRLLVSIERVCKGVVDATVFADSEGRFSLSGDASGCQVRAYLPGYLSQSIPASAELGTLILRPRGTGEAALRSPRTKDLSANKNAWRAYLKGLDEASKDRWRGAEDFFHDATVAFPWAPSPWLCLGIIQERQGDALAAKKSYREAIKTEDSFALPYVYAAALEVARGDWQEALNDSDKIVQLDAKAFPGAWLARAWANLNLHQMDAAEKSVSEGIQLDSEHRFPEFEYVLGLILLDKRDPAAAGVHFRQYLALEPQGARAAAARAEIERIPAHP